MEGTEFSSRIEIRTRTSRIRSITW